MKFIRNASWATRIVGVLSVVALILGSIAAEPFVRATFEMVGAKGLALLVLGYLTMIVTLFFPAWWPWWRARRSALSQRWLFVVVVWGIAVGGVCAVAAAIVLPVSILNVFFVPQFQEMGLLTDRVPFLGWISNYWWVAVPFLQALATVYATRFLAPRWHAVRRAWSPAA